MFKHRSKFYIDLKDFFKNKERPTSKQIQKQQIEKFITEFCKQNNFRLEKNNNPIYGFKDLKDQFGFSVLHNCSELTIRKFYKSCSFLIKNEDNKVLESLTQEEVNDLISKSINRVTLQVFRK